MKNCLRAVSTFSDVERFGRLARTLVMHCSKLAAEEFGNAFFSACFSFAFVALMLNLQRCEWRMISGEAS